MVYRLYRHWAMGRLPNAHMQAKAEQALSIIDNAVKEYKLDAVFALVSGGDDSLAMSQLAACHERFAGIIHIDTLTGITDTDAWKTGQPESIPTRHVIEQAKNNKWELIIKTPFTRYEMLITKNGFPGPAMHSQMYQMLKERPLRQAKKEAVKIGGKKIGFVAGGRKGESIRRMGTVNVHRKDHSGIWINPLWDWSTYEMKQFSYSFDVRNPVSISLGMSGECGCGAYASPDEANVINHLYPQQGERIRAWEAIATAAQPVMGFDTQYCQWGHAQGKRISGKQLSLPMCEGCIGGTVNRELVMVKKNMELKTA